MASTLFGAFNTVSANGYVRGSWSNQNQSGLRHNITHQFPIDKETGARHLSRVQNQDIITYTYNICI